MINKTITSYIILTTILLSGSILSFFVRQKLETKQQPQAQPITIAPPTQQSQYPDYDNFEDMTQLNIAENVEIKGNVTIKGSSLNKSFQLNAKNSIESAYIYIEASVNGKPLGFYDDIYLKINGIGGHLIKDENLLPAPQKENISTYFLPLASISYKPNRGSKKSDYNNNNDFLSIINESQKFEIIAHINSKKKSKVFIKITVGYNCIDDDLAMCELK
jgi:hypothetical protein